MSGRIEQRFTMLKDAKRAGLVTFMCGGDPDPDTFHDILQGLPAAGADVIEIGIPFTDPMADGPAIQAGGLRAILNGMTLTRLLEQVRRFRETNSDTPIVLMGYFNPVHAYGTMRFVKDAREAGVDGLIVVDLPPEEDEALCLPAQAEGLDFIRLATPTTDDKRLPRVLENTSGFLYYVSIAGITGTAAPSADRVAAAVDRIRRSTNLPIAVGFGIREPAQAAEVARGADAAVVGSALVDIVRANLDDDGHATPGLVKAVHDKVSALAKAVHGARQDQEIEDTVEVR